MIIKRTSYVDKKGAHLILADLLARDTWRSKNEDPQKTFWMRAARNRDIAILMDIDEAYSGFLQVLLTTSETTPADAPRLFGE